MSVYITIYFRTIINIFLIPSVPFFDNRRQAISTFIKSLHARPAIIFVADEASISPPSLPTNVERNVERKIDIEARGIRTREKSGLPVSVKKMKAPHVRSRTMGDVDTFTGDVSWHYVAVVKIKK